MPRISLSAHLLLAIAAVAASPAAAADSVVTAIEAVETAFRVTLSDGTFKQGRELAGAVLVFAVNGKPTRIRIASIEPDPTDKAVLLHDFRIESTGEPLCGPGPDGLRLGFPLAGRTAEDGRFVEAGTGTFELVCTSGAQGKCVRFGYRAWEQRTDGRSMRDYFNACVRLLRADYCGDGHGWSATEHWSNCGTIWAFRNPIMIVVPPLPSRRDGQQPARFAWRIPVFPRTSPSPGSWPIVRDFPTRRSATNHRRAARAPCCSTVRNDRHRANALESGAISR